MQSLRLPTLPSALPDSGKKRKLSVEEREKAYRVCDLEESLVPFYCTASNLTFCLLVI